MNTRTIAFSVTGVIVVALLPAALSPSLAAPGTPPPPAAQARAQAEIPAPAPTAAPALHSAAVPPTTSQSDTLADFDWLVGEWQRQTRNGSAVERWVRDGGMLVGEARVQRGEQSMQTEALLIAAMAGDVYYIAKPRENPYPVAFRLVSHDGGEIVFENPEHDFPQRIIYRRTADDAMTAVIEGPGEGGAPQSIAFEFTRR